MNDTLHAELSEIILNLERIYQFIPNDLSTLQLLNEAYLRAGDIEQAGDYLFRLSEQAISQENPVHSSYAINQIRSDPYRERNFDTVMAQLEDVAGDYIHRKESVNLAHHTDVYAEISLAYKLMESDEIDQREYAGIAYELSSLAARGSNEPITVQHALKHRNQSDMENVLAAIVTDSGMPFVQLEHFELDPDIFTELPREYMLEKGAILFDRMGKDAMVAVLNPYDKGLQMDLKGILKCSCHFFLISAREFDLIMSEDPPSPADEPKDEPTIEEEDLVVEEPQNPPPVSE